MPIQTIDRGTSGDATDKFKIGQALDTCQNNDEYLDLNKVGTVNTFADLATTPGGSGQIVTIKGHTIAGTGGGDFIDTAGTITTDNGTKINNTVTSGRYWKRINCDKLTPEMFGAFLDGSTNDNAAFLAFQTASLNAKVDTATVNTRIIKDQVDSVFIGDGIFTGPLGTPFNKYVIPYSSKSDDQNCVDVVPTKHLKWACQLAKPTVMLIGDSISTYNANSNSRGDMLSDTLRSVLNNQFPNGVNFFNRAIAGTSYASLFNNNSSASIPWYTTSVVNWITDVTTSVNPDIVICSFGMNDGSGETLTIIKNAIDYWQGLSKPPSIILCTCLVPRPNSVNATPDGKTVMLARDYSAGMVRSYGKYRNLGILDFNRKMHQVQDGFDPLSSAFRTGLTPTLTVDGAGRNVFVSQEEVEDFSLLFYFDDSVSQWAIDGIVVEFSTNGTSFLQLSRSGANLGVSLFCDGTNYNSGFFPATFTNLPNYNLTVEKRGNYLAIYQQVSPTFGQYSEPIFYDKLVAPGGVHKVKAYSKIVTAMQIVVGEPVKNKPSTRNIDLWGDESAGSRPYGGSGWNHPSSWTGGLVYRPVVEACDFYTYIDRVGSVNVPAASTAIVIPLSPAEPLSVYKIELSVDGIDIGVRIWPTGKLTTQFTITFSAASTNGVASIITWRLIR
jgi:hypothetical protein